QRARKLSNSPDVLLRTLSRLIIVWLADERAETKLPVYDGSTSLSFPNLHRLRMEALVERVKNRQNTPLLCLPSDEFGWLENDALAQRQIPEDPWDKCFAILRMRSTDAKLISAIVGTSEHPAVQFAQSWRALKTTANVPVIDWTVERDEGP